MKCPSSHPHLQACRRTYSGNKSHEKTLEPLFSFSIFSFCRNIAVQQVRLHGRGPPLFQYIIFGLYAKKNPILTNIILNFCHVLPIDPPILHTGCLKTTFVQRPTVEINEVLGEQSAKENIIKRQGHTIMKKNPGFIVYCGCSPWSECKRERNWESQKEQETEREHMQDQSQSHSRVKLMSSMTLWFARAKPGMTVNHGKVNNYVKKDRTQFQHTKATNKWHLKTT